MVKSKYCFSRGPQSVTGTRTHIANQEPAPWTPDPEDPKLLVSTLTSTPPAPT